MQLCVMVFYGVFVLRFDAFDRLLGGSAISVDVAFGDDVDAFDRFVDALYETKQLVTLMTNLSMINDVFHLYTTDVTMDNQVTLSSGRFPEFGTAEFIHSHETGDEQQVGVIDDILPGYVFSITHFSNPANLPTSGFYFFRNTDIQTVQAFVNVVTPYVVGISIFDGGWEAAADFWVRLWHGLAGHFQVIEGRWEFLALVATFLLALFLLMLQYGILITET